MQEHHHVHLLHGPYRLALLALCVAALLVFTFSLTCIQASATSSICTVDDLGGVGVDYVNIQAAIDDPQCYRVQIHPGSYSEHLIVDRNVELIGAGQESTIIDGSNAGRVIQVIDASVVISGVTIQNGIELYGGGIYINENSHSAITRSKIVQNGAHAHGGGIYSDGHIELNEIVLGFNAASGHGGGVYATGVISATDILLHDNEAEQFGGGIAIFLASGAGRDSGTQLALESSEILSNTAASAGGGIYVYGEEAIVRLVENHIRSNSAQEGSGVYLDFEYGGLSTVRFDRNIVSNSVQGAGILTRGRGIHITNNVINDNRGPGIAVVGSANLGTSEIVNNTIWGNDGSGVYFGYWFDLDVILSNNVFAHNHGYGVQLSWPWPEHVTVLSNAFWENDLGHSSDESVQIGVNGNISTPPWLADPAANDWHLAACSALIDSGIDNEAILVDFYGNPRPYNVRWDIGASEYTGIGICLRLFLPTTAFHLPVYLQPGEYQVNRCEEKTLYIQGVRAGVLEACVPSVEIGADGFMQFHFSWRISYAEDVEPIRKYPDTDNRNMYITDNHGDRYDHIEVGGAAAEFAIMEDGVALHGWFLFHPARQGATSFTFHDDDVGLLIPHIDLGS